MTTHIILLRAIGPVTHRLMRMEQWREAVAAAGYGAPETWLATGNMVLTSRKRAETIEAEMAGMLAGFALPAGVIPVVRAPEDLANILAANPFTDAAETRRDALAGFFAKAPADLSWVAAHRGEERLHVVDDRHLIVDYPMQISKARLTPAVIERRSGVALTARNWNTISALVSRAEKRVL